MASNIPYPDKKVIRVTPTLSTDAYMLQEMFYLILLKFLMQFFLMVVVLN